MSITKRAILIASALTDDDPIKDGVETDIKKWMSFLMKPMGGCWDEKEIDVVPNTSSYSLIQHILKLEPVDYVFFVYSGHGFSDSTDDYIYFGLNGCDSIGVSVIKQKLKRVSDRGTMIIDACRLKHTYKESTNVTPSFPKTSAQIIGESYNNWWENQFHNCKSFGIAVIQSCLIGQKSYMYDNNICSVFSHQMSMGLYDDDGDIELNVGKAFSNAAKHTKKTVESWNQSKLQQPECSMPDVDYPFWYNPIILAANNFA